MLFLREDEIKGMKDKVGEMFKHGFDSYMRYAYPADELCPLSCAPRFNNDFGNISLTLIDSLDSLFLFGHSSLFVSSLSLVVSHLNFKINSTVSVFETNIRVLGGLLSAYLLLITHLNDSFVVQNNANGLSLDILAQKTLEKSVEIADILLLSFQTPTGLPFGSVNLLYGVAPNESRITSTASCGSFLLEFGILSNLTGDQKYVVAARRALFELYRRRNIKTGLIGNHINVESGVFTHTDSGVGAGIDSYFEYLLKGYILFGNFEYQKLWKEFLRSIEKYVHKGPWYIDVQMAVPNYSWLIHNSLTSFFPGLMVHDGNIQTAKESVRMYFSIFQRFGAIPEGLNIFVSEPQTGQLGYPLRPELAESIFHLYRATKDPVYFLMGKEFVDALNINTRVACGFANIKNVLDGSKEDKMESFLLSETLKYLYLLFDVDNEINKEDGYIFSTEAHVFPRIFRHAHDNLKSEFGEVDLRLMRCEQNENDYFDLIGVNNL